MGKFGIISGTTGFPVEQGIEHIVELDKRTVTVTEIPIGGDTAFLLNRHFGGMYNGHPVYIPPHLVPYAEQIEALKSLGVDKLISMHAGGRLGQAVPGMFGLPDDAFSFDLPRDPRNTTLSMEGLVIHAGEANPFSAGLNAIAQQAYAQVAADIAVIYQREDRKGVLTPGLLPYGTVVTINGPTFATVAKENAYRRMLDDPQYIVMTVDPTTKLAREAGIALLSVVIVSDHSNHPRGPSHVTHKDVFEATQIIGPAVYLFADRIIRLTPRDFTDPAFGTLPYSIVPHQFNFAYVAEVMGYPKRAQMMQDALDSLK